MDAQGKGGFWYLSTGTLTKLSANWGLDASPDSDVVAVLLISHPRAMETITQELADYCPGLCTADERVFLQSEARLAFHTA